MSGRGIRIAGTLAYAGIVQWTKTPTECNHTKEREFLLHLYEKGCDFRKEFDSLTTYPHSSQYTKLDVLDII